MNILPTKLYAAEGTNQAPAPEPQTPQNLTGEEEFNDEEIELSEEGDFFCRSGGNRRALDNHRGAGFASSECVYLVFPNFP